MPDFLPRVDADLLVWLRSFDNRIVADWEQYNLPQAMAAEHHALFIAFEQAYLRAIAPATRTAPSIAAKDGARAAIKRCTRSVAGFLRAKIEVSDTQRVLAGLKVRRSGRIAKIAAPTVAPCITIVERIGTDVRICVRGSNKAKPDGARSALFFTFIGERPPERISDWRLCGGRSRSFATIQFPRTLAPGTKVWMIAQWLSPTSDVGPLCNPVSAYIAGGAMSPPDSVRAA